MLAVISGQLFVQGLGHVEFSETRHAFLGLGFATHHQQGLGIFGNQEVFWGHCESLMMRGPVVRASLSQSIFMIVRQLRNQIVKDLAVETQHTHQPFQELG